VYNTADGGSRHHILPVDNNIYHYKKLASHTEGTLESNFFKIFIKQRHDEEAVQRNLHISTEKILNSF